MRDGWQEVAVEDVAQVVGGGTPRSNMGEYWGGDVAWLTPRDLAERPARYTTAGSRSISEAGLKGSGAKLLPAGAVLLTSRAPVGYVTVAAGPIATNQGFKSLILKDGQSSEFWYYLLGASTDYLRANSGGSTFQEISGSTLKSLRFSVPPLAEQRRIVDLVGALDDTIAAVKETVTGLEHSLNQLRNRFPAGRSAELREVLEAIASGVSTKPVDGAGRRLNMLTLAAIRPGLFRPDQVKDVGAADLPERALLKDGDLLITRSNTPERVGYIAIAHNVVEDTFLPDLVWRLVPNTELVSSEYLEHLLSSPGYRATISSSASGTSQSMRKINKTNFSTIRIPVPSKGDQETYVAPLRAMSESLEELGNLADSLRTLRANLLTDLLSGEHEIPASYDEIMEGVPMMPAAV